MTDDTPRGILRLNTVMKELGSDRELHVAQGKLELLQNLADMVAQLAELERARQNENERLSAELRYRELVDRIVAVLQAKGTPTRPPHRVG